MSCFALPKWGCDVCKLAILDLFEMPMGKSHLANTRWFWLPSYFPPCHPLLLFLKGLVCCNRVRAKGASWPNLLLKWVEAPCLRFIYFLDYKITYKPLLMAEMPLFNSLPQGSSNGWLHVSIQPVLQEMRRVKVHQPRQQEGE